MKNPEQVANNIMNQRMIEIATTAVIINNRITTHITLDIRPGQGNTKSTLPIPIKIFSTMKLVNPALKKRTFTNKTINSSDQFSLEKCTSIFKAIFKCSKSSRLCITHKIESTIPLSVIKYDNKN